MIDRAALAAGRNVNGFTVRAVDPDDAAEVARLYECALANPRRQATRSAIAEAPMTSARFELMTQTGSAFTVAERGNSLVRCAGMTKTGSRGSTCWWQMWRGRGER